MKGDDKNMMDGLINRYLTGNASENERIELENWISLSDKNSLYFRKLQSVWEDSLKMKTYQEIDTESSLKNVKKRIDFKQDNRLKVKPLWIFIRIAAVLIVSIGIYLITRQIDHAHKELKMTRIESGNELKTVILPDSSVVSLNRNSRIEYSEDYGKQERRLKFDGEAYFEVKPDKLHPFVIETGLSETRVLGTAFNLRAVKGSKSVSIVVTHGLVEFSKKSVGNEHKVLLEKGEKAILNESIVKGKNDDLNFLSWKTGIFIFNNEPLPKALEILSDYYHVQFKIQDSTMKAFTINGKYEKLSLKDLISILEMTLGFRVERSGETYILK
jgi:transmembrane sensor